MNKDLPRVFANPIKKQFQNNKEVYYEVMQEIEIRKSKMENIPQKINEIFANPHHVYKSKVKITTNDDIFEREIVGIANNNLLTLSGEKISINTIESIERIN